MSSVVKMVDILLVEDNPADVDLTREVLSESKLSNKLNVVYDGEDALRYLRKLPPYEDVKLPDLILLDLNLPKLDGREVLAEIKKDDRYMGIPVVILTTSIDERDIAAAYSTHANCYINKPVDIDQFMRVVRAIEDFWFSIVKLPKKED